MNKSQMHCAKWKKSNSKNYMPYNSVYVLFWKRQNYRNRNQWLPGIGMEKSVDFKGAVWGTILYFHGCGSETTICICLNQWFSTGGDLLPRGYQTMSEDICGCHNLGSATGVWWVEAGDTAIHPTGKTPTAIHCQGQQCRGWEPLH